MHLDYSHFEKNLHFSHGIGFEDLQAFHTEVDFHLGLGMFHNILQVNRDLIGMNCNLGESNSTFWLVVVWPMHRDNFQFLNQGQVNLAHALCMNFVPNIPLHALNQIQKEPGQKELLFENGNVVKRWSWSWFEVMLGQWTSLVNAKIEVFSQWIRSWTL